MDRKFEMARARYYLTAIQRVLMGVEAYQRPGILSKKERIPTGIPFSVPRWISSGPQCVTVPLAIRGQDLERVLVLGDRLALEARSSFVRVYRDRGQVNVEFTLPPEQWLKVRLRELPQHRHQAASFGQLSLGQVARLSFERSPHKLISGGSQMGKTTCESSLVISLARSYAPEELKLLIINPKREPSLDAFARLPHLAARIAHDHDDCVNLLRFALGEMDLRGTDRGRCGQRWVVVIDEVSDLCLAREEAGVIITRLVQLAGSLNINVIAATQSPYPSVFGKTGSLGQANFGGYLVFKIPTQYAFFATGGLKGVRTAELGGEGDNGKGDGYAISGGNIVRFRGALPERRDYEALPHTDREPDDAPTERLAGDAVLDGGMSWEIGDLADRAGYALALSGGETQNLASRHLASRRLSANRIRKQFGGAMVRSQWVRDFVMALQERTTYWQGQVLTGDGDAK